MKTYKICQMEKNTEDFYANQSLLQQKEGGIARMMKEGCHAGL